MLDVWPALLLIVSNRLGLAPVEAPGVESNILAAVEHHDRVREIDLRCVPGWFLERLATVAQEPYPELTSLELRSNDGFASVLPDSFLGGSAPRLRTLVLDSIPFPGLPKPLLTASNLVQLHLNRIPNSGYISPDAMVACVLTMNNLEFLHLNTDLLYLAQIDGAGVRLRGLTLFSLLSPVFGSTARVNIWRTSLPRSVLLNSTSST